MEWTRRSFVAGWLAAPGLGWQPRGARCGVVRVRLESEAPWRELEAVWRRLVLGVPERVVARACAGWWQGGTGLPDRWAAWLEFGDGRVLVAECRPQEKVQEAGPGRGFAGGEAVAEALRSS